MNFEKYLPPRKNSTRGESSFLVRSPIGSGIHVRMKELAKEKGVSLNALCVAIIAAALDEQAEPGATNG